MSDALSWEQVKLWTVGEINAECAACRWVAESDHIAQFAQLEAMTQQIAKLEERLEIGYAFDVMGIRITIPKAGPDGIECREETIRLQDETITDLTAKLEAMTQDRDVAERERIEWVQRGERAEEAWAEANAAAKASLDHGLAMGQEALEFEQQRDQLQATVQELLAANNPYCLNCGRTAPCMELKPGDPGIPCTFEYTPRQMLDIARQYKQQLAEAQATIAQPEHQRIATRCPSCNSSTLFIALGNWLTCSLIGCKDPILINSVGDRYRCLWQDYTKLEAERDQLQATITAQQEQWRKTNDEYERVSKALCRLQKVNDEQQEEIRQLHTQIRELSRFY